MKRITYRYQLYLSDSINYGDIFKIKHNLNTSPLNADVYLITRSINENEQLDIFHSKYLPQKFYNKHDKPIHVFGITKTKEEALTIVEKIAQECLAARGDANIIKYLIGE